MSGEGDLKRRTFRSPEPRRRIAVLAPEPIRPKMAGMGIRALELARALHEGGFDVRLLIANDPREAAEVAGSVPVTAAPPEKLGPAARDADAAVVSGHAANWWFHQLPDVPVAVDLYDPFPIENLHYVATLGEGTAHHDHQTLSLALARADFFFCASEEQRLFYAGALYTSGRIGPRNFPPDPTLSRLLAVVPFGAPRESAKGDGAAGRAAAGVPPDGPMVLFGGIYDWYDPGLLLEAWPAILAKVPRAKLLFFENPNPETTPQGVCARTRECARAIDPAGGSIFFSPWLSYAARENLYAAVDLAVSISSAGLETDLAYRTRLLDAAWGGVPSVSVGGGTLARELGAAGAGVAAEPSASSLASAVAGLLEDGARRERFSRAARLFASKRTWEEMATPLAAWCREAGIDPGRLPFSAVRPRSFWRRLLAR